MGHRVRKSDTLLRWMRAYAAATATTAAYETIRDAATSDRGDKPAKTTVQPYTDVLERLWVLDRVDAWLPTRNPVSRLSSPPEHHLVDTALATSLLGVGGDGLLDGREPGPTTAAGRSGPRMREAPARQRGPPRSRPRSGWGYGCGSASGSAGSSSSTCSTVT